MYELRYYSTLKDLSKQTRNYELVGCYYERQLANGMRKKKALEPQYQEQLLKVIVQFNIKSYASMQKKKKYKHFNMDSYKNPVFLASTNGK